MDTSYVLVKSSKVNIYAKFVGKNGNHAYVSNNGIGTKNIYLGAKGLGN
jgi:hypothetical protein